MIYSSRRFEVQYLYVAKWLMQLPIWFCIPWFAGFKDATTCANILKTCRLGPGCFYRAVFWHWTLRLWTGQVWVAFYHLSRMFFHFPCVSEQSCMLMGSAHLQGEGRRASQEFGGPGSMQPWRDQFCFLLCLLPCKLDVVLGLKLESPVLHDRNPKCCTLWVAKC